MSTDQQTAVSKAIIKYDDANTAFADAMAVLKPLRADPSTPAGTLEAAHSVAYAAMVARDAAEAEYEAADVALAATHAVAPQNGGGDGR